MAQGQWRPHVAAASTRRSAVSSAAFHDSFRRQDGLSTARHGALQTGLLQGAPGPAGEGGGCQGCFRVVFSQVSWISLLWSLNGVGFTMGAAILTLLLGDLESFHMFAVI